MKKKVNNDGEHIIIPVFSSVYILPISPIFFVNGQIFFMTYSRKICFTTVTHLVNRKVNGVWAAMHQIYQMYMLRGFHIVEIAGDGEFVWIVDQVASLPTNPTLDLAAANEHVGLIERNIRFLKEKVRSLRHS